jgi:hypothetical protein
MDGHVALRIAGAIVIGLILLGIAGVILQLLWNSTIPEVFGLRTITTWQAIKLLLIALLLFGGHRGYGRGHWRHWDHDRDRDRDATEEQIRGEPDRNPGSASRLSHAPGYRIPVARA